MRSVVGTAFATAIVVWGGGTVAASNGVAAAKPSVSRPDPALAAAAVQACVEQIHKAGYQEFDAYYNQATQKVENNQLSALQSGYTEAETYLFRKCMASQGFPMGG